MSLLPRALGLLTLLWGERRETSRSEGAKAIPGPEAWCLELSELRQPRNPEPWGGPAGPRRDLVCHPLVPNGFPDRPEEHPHCSSVRRTEKQGKPLLPRGLQATFQGHTASVSGWVCLGCQVLRVSMLHSVSAANVAC